MDLSDNEYVVILCGGQRDSENLWSTSTLAARGATRRVFWGVEVKHSHKSASLSKTADQRRFESLSIFPQVIDDQEMFLPTVVHVTAEGVQHNVEFCTVAQSPYQSKPVSLHFQVRRRVPHTLFVAPLQYWRYLVAAVRESAALIEAILLQGPF